MLIASACTSSPAPNDQPALIVQPDVDSRAELLSTVRTALNNAPLTLADDALTRDSVLMIERQTRLDPYGLPANGRELGLPERFVLVTDGKRCVLTQARTQQQWLLTHTHCIAHNPKR
jgi:hypothetical protein